MAKELVDMHLLLLVTIDKNIMDNLGTLKEKLCCEGVTSEEQQEYNPNQGK